MNPTKCEAYEVFFKNLSSTLRIKIIQTLEESPKNVTEICKELGEEQSKISHNLKHLADCSIIEATQIGKHRVYSLNKEIIVPMLELVDKHARTTCKKAKDGTCHGKCTC